MKVTEEEMKGKGKDGEDKEGKRGTDGEIFQECNLSRGRPKFLK